MVPVFPDIRKVIKQKKPLLISGFLEVPGGFEPPSPVLQTDP